MSRRPTATAWLVGLSVLFLVAFWVQRSGSGFLAAEAGALGARQLAAETGLRPSEVLALHELHGGRLAPDELAERTRELAAVRDELGDVLLAVLAVRGRRALAERLGREARGQGRDELHRRVRGCREAVEDAVRFASVAERFASRGHDSR